MANTQNFDINIPRIAAGMKRMNDMKGEIRSMIELLIPYLLDMAQAEVTNLPDSRRNGDYIDIIRIANGVEGSTLSLRAALQNHPENLMYFNLDYSDLNGDTTCLLTGSRNVRGGAPKASPMPHQLAKENVASCYHAIEELTKHVAERYPDEIKMELDLYLSLVP